MARAKAQPGDLPAANDNKSRAEYMREYMARRRHGGQTMRSLLREGLACVEAHAPMEDLRARMFIAAVKDLLQAPERAKGSN
jgi:hypothetical protein